MIALNRRGMLEEFPGLLDSYGVPIEGTNHGMLQVIFCPAHEFRGTHGSVNGLGVMLLRVRRPLR